MPQSPAQLWWVVVAGILALVVVLIAFGIALVIYQRRFLGLHRLYASQLLATQDEERAWVAREVHDDALQRLALLRHECDRVAEFEPPLPEAQREALLAIRQELDDLGVLLRGLAHRLHPALLDQGGLCAALTGLVSEVERSGGPEVRLLLPQQAPRVDAAAALAIYRIAQEALRNVAQHAGASEAHLVLSARDGGCELEVSDAGRGFDAAGPLPGPGLGLVAMRERARLAGGKLSVASRRGAGTVVRARFVTEPA
ncbi:MAG: histidine kinase [Gemmatimonadota bacterium]|nr:histidine kinase [Gemmatimonadota bacterium]